MKTVLNVGGGTKEIPIPHYYAGWKQDLLDIDPTFNPDIVMDARELERLPAATYDAVYCSDNLEHYHRADGARVLEGFAHILKENGFAEVRVPNMLAVINHITQEGLDLDDTIYGSPAGPVMVRDVIYGYSLEIERGNEFFAHKTGFSPKSLAKFVNARGFAVFAISLQRKFEITAYLFKSAPSPELWTMLQLNPAQRPIKPP